jgi:tetratricopeptide (TPR) repeat protein
MNHVVGDYLAFGDFTSALQLVNAQLSKSPNDVPNLNLQAAILIRSGNAAAAIPILDHILMITNLPAVRLNRAIARLACQDFEGAETDYRELEKSGAETGPACYGLAAIAGHRHDTNQTVNYLRLCLTNTPPGTPLWREASARLQALKPDPGAK